MDIIFFIDPRSPFFHVQITCELNNNSGVNESPTVEISGHGSQRAHWPKISGEIEKIQNVSTFQIPDSVSTRSTDRFHPLATTQLETTKK